LWLVNISNVQNWCLKLNLGSWFMRCFSRKKLSKRMWWTSYFNIRSSIDYSFNHWPKKADQLINYQNIGGEITLLLKKTIRSNAWEMCWKWSRIVEKEYKILQSFYSFSVNIKRWFLFTIFFSYLSLLSSSFIDSKICFISLFWVPACTNYPTFYNW